MLRPQGNFLPRKALCGHSECSEPVASAELCPGEKAQTTLQPRPSSVVLTTGG